MIYAAFVSIPGEIVNTIIAEPEDVKDENYNWVDITDVDPQPSIGWTYDGTTFSAPVSPDPAPDQSGVEGLRGDLFNVFSNMNDTLIARQGMTLNDVNTAIAGAISDAGFMFSSGQSEVNEAIYTWLRAGI